MRQINATQFNRALLGWYDQHQRELPFRSSKQPYHIWLSEVMLQQTTMAAMIPYYERFLGTFPTLESVAHASQDQLLTLWQGLGYYNRIKNFHEAAKQVVFARNGKFPHTAAEWQTLKGVGKYIAAAVASIVNNEAALALDGNLIRVFARLQNDTRIRHNKALISDAEALGTRLIDARRPGDFNQALMDLGSSICTPKSPLCPSCPIQSFCRATHANPERCPQTTSIKLKTVKIKAYVIESASHILLQKPNGGSLVKSMWQLPLVTHKHSCWETLPSAKGLAFKPHIAKRPLRHTITNKAMTTQIYSVTLPQRQLTKHAQNDFVAVCKTNIDSIALNTLSRKVLDALANRSRSPLSLQD